MLKHTGSVGVAAITAFSLQLFPHSLTTVVFILTVEIIFVTLHSPHSQAPHPTLHPTSPPAAILPRREDDQLETNKSTEIKQVAHGRVSSRAAQSRIKVELCV